MRFAIIRDGIVANVVEAESALDASWVPCVDGNIGDTYQGGQFISRRAGDSGYIAARRYLAETAGIEVDGLTIPTDDRSKLLLAGAAIEAMLDPGYQMQFKVDSSAWVTLEAPHIIGIARAVRGHVQACFNREAELNAALADGTYDDSMLEQGWPERVAEEDA